MATRDTAPQHAQVHLAARKVHLERMCERAQVAVVNDDTICCSGGCCVASLSGSERHRKAWDWTRAAITRPNEDTFWLDESELRGAGRASLQCVVAPQDALVVSRPAALVGTQVAVRLQ
jgi:hypothetical protein